MIYKRKNKSSKVVMTCFILFFIVYFITFFIFCKKEMAKEEADSTESQIVVNEKSLFSQFKYSKYIYLSNNDISDVEVDSMLKSEIISFLDDIIKIRTPDKYTPTYTGHIKNDIKFSTNGDILRLYSIDKEEFYKIPIKVQEEIKHLLKKSIYGSIDYLTNFNDWTNVTIKYQGKSFELKKANYKNFANSILKKKMLGKYQPEYTKERQEDNFEITIQHNKHKIVLDVIGKNYLKVSVNDTISYYEVYPNLNEYLHKVKVVD